MTREVIAKVKEKFPTIYIHLEGLNKDYNNDALNKDAVRKEIYGYTCGLHDAGIISERERQVLLIYTFRKVGVRIWLLWLV